MITKQFTYKGKTLDELKKMNFNELIKILPSRQRRTLERGYTDAQKKLLEKIKKFKEINKEGKSRKILKTHCRGLIVLPDMVGITIYVYSGKSFEPVIIVEEMIGHYLGEFVDSRRRILHSSPGVGATKSSSGAKKK